MSYNEALAIVKEYFDKSVFTIEETQAFMTLLDKCESFSN